MSCHNILLVIFLMFMGKWQCEEILINQENDLLFPFSFHLFQKPDGLRGKVSLSNAYNVCGYCMLSSQMQTLQSRNTRFI